MKPAFLIAIDTEGDDVWSRPQQVTTHNARYLPRFQQLCERYGFLPTYLVNFEMANDDAFREFGRDVLARGTAEIGMHLHGWDTPPIEPLGGRDWYDQPYAPEYPADLVRRKATTMTRVLEDIFGCSMTSHRAGRWGFDAAYARTLIALGYEVDCSVTPGISWREHPGLAGGNGGPDFSGFPSDPYRLDASNIALRGSSDLIELPMTIVAQPRPLHRELARRVLGRKGQRRVWFRPDGRNLDDLHFVLDETLRRQRPYLQFTLHSSEFMPGGSPAFRDDAAIETLYRHMEEMFARIAPAFEGMGLTAFARRWASTQGATSST